MKYDLETDFQQILRKKRNEWRKTVEEKINARNKERLLEDCYKHGNDGGKTEKTKTRTIIAKLNANDYKRKPCTEIYQCNKRETKTVLLARYGMLECGKNFKGTLNVMCNQCDVLDDEHHRLNECPKFESINNRKRCGMTDFNQIYSDSITELRQIIPAIMRVWNIKNGNGSMNCS